MRLYQQEPVSAKVTVAAEDYLRTRYYLRENEPTDITVGRGQEWTPLACKEVYAKGVKTARELACSSCLFDLTAAAELGQAGVCAAVEGILGGGYEQKFSLTQQVEPSLDCYVQGQGLEQRDLDIAMEVARSVITARNLVNRPANLLTPEQMAQAIADMAEGLPVEAAVYHRDQLESLGFGALLAIGDSSANPPAMAVLRYTGAPERSDRLGLVGKGVTYDTGGYSLKSSNGMAKMKGDMAGGAAAACALRALAAAGVRANVTAVVPLCENRVSPGSALPGDVIRSLSGQTIEVLSTDAEGRLILADALTWSIREEKCTHLVDIATLTGAICNMLGSVAAGVMASGDEPYIQLEKAAALSGERYWRMPAFPEYEKLIESDLADVRNTSKDGCSAIAAGLFLKRFTQGLPWLHLDIAGTADCKKPIWQHQVSGATGAAVSTLFYLAKQFEQ